MALLLCYLASCFLFYLKHQKYCDTIAFSANSLR